MNVSELKRQLIAAARATPPSDCVPFAFEKRVMALVAARPTVDLWAVWARALWYGAAPCVAIMLLLSAWSFFGAPNTPTASSGDLSQEFENTVLAAVDQEPPADPAE